MTNSLLLLLGRILISLLYIWAAVAKLDNIPGTIAYISSKHMPFVYVSLAAAVFFQIAGSILLLLGYKARLGAWILILFTIPATIIFHDYWNLQGQERHIEQVMFLKDLAIVGGLLAFAVFGPGKYALDKS